MNFTSYLQSLGNFRRPLFGHRNLDCYSKIILACDLNMHVHIHMHLVSVIATFCSKAVRCCSRWRILEPQATLASVPFDTGRVWIIFLLALGLL
jgi:hypothetical protein